MREIKIGDKSFKIHYGQNAICALEDELDASIATIYERISANTIRMKDIRALIWAGLLREQRDLTPEVLGDLCDDAGVKLTDIFGDCVEELNASFQRMIKDDKANDENSEKKH